MHNDDDDDDYRKYLSACPFVSDILQEFMKATQSEKDVQDIYYANFSHSPIMDLRPESKFSLSLDTAINSLRTKSMIIYPNSSTPTTVNKGGATLFVELLRMKQTRICSGTQTICLNKHSGDCKLEVVSNSEVPAITHVS
jgi:hypothetical protein